MHKLLLTLFTLTTTVTSFSMEEPAETAAEIAGQLYSAKSFDRYLRQQMDANREIMAAQQRKQLDLEKMFQENSSRITALSAKKITLDAARRASKQKLK